LIECERLFPIPRTTLFMLPQAEFGLDENKCYIREPGAVCLYISKGGYFFPVVLGGGAIENGR
jgi:hypothetical protein